MIGLSPVPECAECQNHQLAKSLCQRTNGSGEHVQVFSICVRRDDKFLRCDWERFKGECGPEGIYWAKSELEVTA